MFSCEFCEISKNTFIHRTPLVAGSAAIIVSNGLASLNIPGGCMLVIVELKDTIVEISL